MLQGILALVGASVLLGVIPSANKYILLSGMSSGSIVFFMQLTIAVSALIIGMITRQSFRVSKKQLVMLLIVGAVGMGGTEFLLNIAYGMIPVGLTTMLHFLYPSIVSIIMVVLFKQKMTKLKLGGILLSVAGMLLIADLSGGIKLAGIAAALCSSLTYTFYMIANEKGNINELPLIIKLFFVSFGSTLAFGIQTAASGTFSLPVGTVVFVQLFFILGLGSMIAFYLLIAGIKLIGASSASFFNMLEPITSLVVSNLIYHDQPSLFTLLGCSLVLSSVLLAALDGSKK